MAICPIGHESGTDDYCEVCGRLMPAQGQQAPGQPEPPLPPPPPGVSPYPVAQDPDATAAVEVCPQCKTPREGQEPFCEGCRWNFVTGSSGDHRMPPPLPSHLPPPFQRGEQPPVPPQGAGGPPQPPSWPAAGAPQAQPHQQSVPYPAPPAPGPPGPALQPPPQQQQPLPPVVTPAPDPVPGQGSGQGQSGQGHGQGPAPSAPPSGSDFVIAPPSGGQPHPQAQPPVQQPAGPAVPQPTWFVVVTADREYFTAMMARSGPEAQGLFFPPYCPERRFELTGHQLRIGRMRHRPNEEAPDIDLSKPPEDPGVSHKHAVLVQQPDGTWAVVDQDSTNGTTVNGAEDPVSAYSPVQLKDGDRVHVGAWTTITLHRAEQ